MKIEKQRYFIDMDGVIVKWNTDANIEEVTAPGYFKNCEPVLQMLEAIKLLIYDNTTDVYILSKVFEDSHSIYEKKCWLKKYLPEMDYSKCIFVPYSSNKSYHIPGGIRKDDVLVDDFTDNLISWSGIGIKFLNGINATKRTWDGYTVSINSHPFVIKNTITGIAKAAS